MPPLGFHDGITCREPIDGDLIIRIGKTCVGLARHWRFAGMTIGIPCRRDDRIQFALQRRKYGICKASAVSLLELLTRQFDGGHSLANVRLRHIASSLPEQNRRPTTTPGASWFRPRGQQALARRAGR